MSAVLIAVPLRVEQLLVRPAARGALVQRTGMGPERSRSSAGRLAGAPGDSLIVLGFCGGLDAQARPGEVIVADEVRSAGDEGHAPVRVACQRVEELLGALEDVGLTVRRGPIVGVGKIATGKRREQLRAGGALAVDMESAWLAAGAAGRPFGVVRIVLDSPSHELFHPQALGGALRAARELRRAAAVALQVWGRED